MKFSSAKILAASLVLASGTLFAQQDFSADVVNMTTQKETPPHISVTKDKMRVDAKSHSGPGGSGVVIVNYATQTTDVIIPDRQMYIESVNGQGPAGMMQRAFNPFRPGDVEDACASWKKLPQNQGGTCNKVGHDTVNGRDTIKYEGTNSKGETATVWIDPKLAFPIKWTGNKGDNWELQNIQVGSQPSSNFEIPAGYQKMDMSQMMNGMGRMPQR
jgi:hypothetical protein